MQFDLVFEGGGAKGMAFVGALTALEAAHHTVGRVLGTSAGAILATSLAAGYGAREMRAALSEQVDGHPVFATFLGNPDFPAPDELQTGAMRCLLSDLDIPFLPNNLEMRIDDWLVRKMAETPGLRNLLSFVDRGGWYAADRFVTWLRRYLDQGDDCGRPRCYSEMTLAELFEATGRELTLVAADSTDGRMLVLNHRTAPDCPVVYAARMSMSVPLLWQEVIWQAGWGLYRDRDLTGHAVVDGGLLSNFPIELLISGDPQVTAVMGPKQTGAIIGFLIDETLPVPGVEQLTSETLPPALAALSTVQRFTRLVNTAMQAHDRAVIDAFENLVVRLPARTYGTTEFGMTNARREALISAAHAVTERYLQQRLSAPPADLAGILPVPDNDLARRRALHMLAE